MVCVDGVSSCPVRQYTIHALAKSTIIKLPDKRRLINTILDSNLSAIFLLGASSDILAKANKLRTIRYHMLTTRKRMMDGLQSALFLLDF